jgi:hypothetical protein
MPIYGTGTGIASGIEGPTVAPATSEERSFWDEVDRFKAKADEAGRLWQKLRGKRQAAASDPKLQAEYDQVMGQAESITAKVSDVERAVAAAKSGVYETVTGWFGLEGADMVKREARAYLGDLGFPQLVIIAVAAAIAWIGSWMADAYIVDRKLTAVENLTAQGIPIDEAGKIISDKPDGGPLDILAGRVGTGIAIAGLAAVVLYFFFEKKRGF